MLVIISACEQVIEPATPVANYVYTHVEHMPQYKGGMSQLVEDILKGTEYPATAKAAGLEGEVLVKFVVAADGTVQAIQLQKGITSAAPHQQAAAQALEAAAIKAVRQQQLGHWTPGNQVGKKVAVSYVIPIKFSLSKHQSHSDTRLLVLALDSPVSVLGGNVVHIPPARYHFALHLRK